MRLPRGPDSSEQGEAHLMYDHIKRAPVLEGAVGSNGPRT